MKKTPLLEIQSRVRAGLGHAFFGVDSPQPDYRGKVRDVFYKDSELLIVTTDRVSAFDVVLGTVPYKGSLLTEQAVFWLEKSKPVIANHLLERVDARTMRCQKAEPFKVEMIVRGFLAGSLLREDPLTRGQAYGLTLDPALKAYQAFETPIVTPTTKADVGLHDEPISLAQVVSMGLATQEQVDEIFASAIALFKLGSAFAKEQGLLLVDTKYEFGLVNGKVTLIDEIHTADSSRYWISSTYHDRIAAGKSPDMLDKERLRKTLIEKGYDGHNMASLPKLDDDMRVDLACHYWQLTEQLTGQRFETEAVGS